MLFVPLLVSAQDKQYYIYNIVTFEGNFKKEGLKVSIDNGKTVEKLKDKEGNRIKFNTPASALMYFISKGWELYVNGSTSEGSSISIDGTECSAMMVPIHALQWYRFADTVNIYFCAF